MGRKHKARFYGAKVKYANICRERLGVGFACRLDVLFRAVASRLGVEWSGTTGHGYELIKQLVEGQCWQPAPVVQVKQFKPPKPPQPTSLPVPVVKGEGRRQRKQAERAKRDEFLFTYEWRALRMKVITKRGARCECCGATPRDNGIVINVDHIKPRLKFPELALEESNLQILCSACNHGKGNWDETDWRDDSAPRLVKGNTA